MQEDTKYYARVDFNSMDDLPTAICLAALKAVEEKEK